MNFGHINQNLSGFDMNVTGIDMEINLPVSVTILKM